MRRVDKKLFGARVKQRMDELDINQPQLARLIGYRQQGINDIVKGKVARPGKLMEIASALRTTEAWLLWEEGPKEVDSVEPEVVSDRRIARFEITEIDIRAGLGGGGVETREWRKGGYHADPVKPDTWHFPTAYVREELRAPMERLKIFETQGDSMQPTINPGERVVIDTSHRVPTPDGVYAIRAQWGDLEVKRLQALRKGKPPRILIISDNQAHVDLEVGVDEIEIVGRVICCLKRL